MSQCGAGIGEGFNVNIPFAYSDSGGYGDDDYDYILEKVVLPIANEFQPTLIVIASGFDACAEDPIGGNLVTPAWFGKATHQMKVGNKSRSKRT